MTPPPSLHRLLRVCELRLRQDPEDPDALFAKAAVLGQLGLYGEALDYLEAVSTLRKDYPGLGQLQERILWEKSQSAVFQTSLASRTLARRRES